MQSPGLVPRSFYYCAYEYTAKPMSRGWFTCVNFDSLQRSSGDAAATANLSLPLEQAHASSSWLQAWETPTNHCALTAVLPDPSAGWVGRTQLFMCSSMLIIIVEPEVWPGRGVFGGRSSPQLELKEEVEEVEEFPECNLRKLSVDERGTGRVRRHLHIPPRGAGGRCGGTGRLECNDCFHSSTDA